MKKKTNISDKALKLINQEQIKLIPKWEFVAKNWGLWLGFIISLGLLILGTGVLWFGMVDNIITPYLWLFIVVIFLILSFVLFEKTKRAYRFDPKIIVLAIVITGLIAGGILFKIGLASQVDRTLESRVSFYRQMVPMRMVVWSNPQNGYLSGVITEINQNYFKLKDFNGKMWKIIGEPLIRNKVKMAVGEEIKIIGEIENNDFRAEEIRPWNGMGQNVMKEN